MGKLSFLSEQTWWKGRVIGDVQFDEHQTFVQAALALRALDVDGFGLISSEGSQASASGVPDLMCNVAAAKYMVPDGKMIGWNASEQIDMSIADQGTLTGPTAAQSAGNKRYVVGVGIHKFSNQVPDTDDDGNPVFSTRLSTSEFGVWMSSDVALADVWYTSTILHNLITSILAAGHVPICLGIREYGATTLDQDHLFEIYRSIQAHEKQRQHGSQLMAELIATGFSMPMVLNSSGVVAISGQAVVGQPGTVTLAGGELVAFCLDGEAGAQNLYKTTDLHKRRVVVRAIPQNTVLTMLAASTQYVVRAKIDPASGLIEVYFGTGFYPDDEKDGWNPGNNSAGSQGGTNLGYLNTWIDIAIATVTTGALGSTPTVSPIRCDHSARLAYLQQQALLVGDKANFVDVGMLISEYDEAQPYVDDNTLSLAKPLSINSGLNLDVAALTFRGGFSNQTPRPLYVTIAADTLALADNTINLIYAEPNLATPVYGSADIGTGGGPIADINKVILGFVRTASGAISQIVYSPMTRAETMIQDVVFHEVHVNTARELHIGPTVARAIADDVGAVAGVFKAPWTTKLDETVANNWDGAVVGGNAFHYVYADPGGNQGAATRSYCKFLLSATRPDQETGRHPTKPNLIFMAGVYKTGGGQLQVMNKKGDLTLAPMIQILNTGQDTSRTAIALASVVPETATHVRILVNVNPLATVGAGSVDVSIYHDATGAAFAVVKASGESGTNASEAYTASALDIPIDRSLAGGRIYYLISDASASTDIFVLGWREGKTQINTANVVAY